MRRHHGILLLAIAALAAPGCSQGEATADQKHGPPQAVAVDLARVTRSQVRSSLDLVGTLLPIRATTIVSDVDGIIDSFPSSQRLLQFEGAVPGEAVPLGLDIGHPVRAGDVLVKIRDKDFHLALEVANASHALAVSELRRLEQSKRPEEIDRLKAALAEASAGYERARADLERAGPLLSKNAIARSNYDAFMMSYRMAAAARDQADAALRLYRSHPTVEELAVAEAQVAAAAAEVALRQEKFDKTAIRAPYDAVISDRYVDVGDRVTAMPRVEIMQIIDPRVLFAEVSVPEKHQGQVALDEVATITAAGVPGELRAKIDLINAKIDLQTRTFRIRVTIDNRRGLLKAGGFVHVLLPVTTASEVLAVPVEAVALDDGRPAVFVYDNGQVRETAVKLGISDGRSYAVRSGLTEGQQVAVGGTSLLADAMAVRPRGSDRTRTAEPEVQP